MWLTRARVLRAAALDDPLLLQLKKKQVAKLRAEESKFEPTKALLGREYKPPQGSGSRTSDADDKASKRELFRRTPVSEQLLDRLQSEHMGMQRRSGRATKRREQPKVPFTPVEALEAESFRRAFKFIAGAEVKTSFPEHDFGEVAFLGRSNVGKSSLLNALADSTIVRVSKTPGLTRALNFFQVNKMGVFVDMPGYGFAFAKEEDKAKWQELIREYLTERKQLRRLFLLLDARHGVKVIDRDVLDTLEALKVKYQVVLTKADLVPLSELARRYILVRDEIAQKRHAVTDVLMASSHSGAGIAKLRRVIRQILQPTWRSPDPAEAKASTDARSTSPAVPPSSPRRDSRSSPRRYAPLSPRRHTPARPRPALSQPRSAPRPTSQVQSRKSSAAHLTSSDTAAWSKSDRKRLSKRPSV